MRIGSAISRDFLEQRYVIEKRSVCSIAREINKSSSAIKANLIKFDLFVPNRLDKSWLTKDFLVLEYVENKKSSHQIASEQNINKSIVLNKLKEHGISLRSQSRLGRPNSFVKMNDKIELDVKYGILTTKRFLGREGWECNCDCGKIIIVTSKDIICSRKKSCGCLKNEKHIGWEGITGNVFCRYKRGAATRGLLFEITPKYMWELFIVQQRKCSISGVEITIGKGKTASLDRINSNIGYIEGNVQWVHKKIQTMKWDLGQHEFIDWCKIIAVNNQKGVV